MKGLQQEFLRVIKLALAEDRASNDLTTNLILKKNSIKKTRGILLAKQKGILLGPWLSRSPLGFCPGESSCG